MGKRAKKPFEVVVTEEGTVYLAVGQSAIEPLVYLCDGMAQYSWDGKNFFFKLDDVIAHHETEETFHHVKDRPKFIEALRCVKDTASAKKEADDAEESLTGGPRPGRGGPPAWVGTIPLLRR